MPDRKFKADFSHLWSLHVLPVSAFSGVQIVKAVTVSLQTLLADLLFQDIIAFVLRLLHSGCHFLLWLFAFVLRYFAATGVPLLVYSKL